MTATHDVSEVPDASDGASESPRTPARRTVLQGACGAGAAAVAMTTLAACGPGGSSSKSTGPTSQVDLGKAADVPVGGGKVYGSQKVVVTQPKKGEYHCFSAICTHQGCTVGSVQGGVIECPCHGSKFSVTDGSVKGGPAPSPLPKVALQVEGGTLKAGPAKKK